MTRRKAAPKAPVRAPRKRTAAAPRPSPPADARETSGSAFPVVGIGASAGGLEALELLFAHVPASSGMAWVVVQHLDPTQKGFLPELLQRFTPLPVQQARDRMKVKPDSVYVIPPNRDLSILNGVLHLLPPAAPRGQRLPIDFFFRALARDRQEMAAGVVLSGMGSDGTLGLRAIKEAAGVTVVQSPKTAKFDAMPRSAVDAGLADFVVPPEAIHAALAGYHEHVSQGASSASSASSASPGARPHGGLDKIVLMLRSETGHDFSLYKKSTLYRRIERRMGIHKIDRIASYIRYLQENPQERGLLFRELLIGVTSFFRDAGAWETLGRKVLPGLVERLRPGQPLRAWIPGCSTGEDAFSLAILFREAAESVKPAGRHALQLYATDIDPDAIDRARQGTFPSSIAADVSPDRLARFFVHEEGRYRIGKEIRESIVFATQNLISDPPFTKLDVVVCRNVLIYFEPELQKKVIPLFHFSLAPGGVLFLGSAESLGSHAELFTPLEPKAKIYRRADFAPAPGPGIFPATFAHVARRPGLEPAEQKEPRQPESLQALAQTLLLSRFSPAAVLTNSAGDILFINGRTGRYLEPAAGKADWNLFAMVRDGLRHDLTTAFRRVVRTGGAESVRRASVLTEDGERRVDVSLQAVSEPEGLRGMVIVVFSESDAPGAGRVPAAGGRSTTSGRRVRPATGTLELALQRARDELQSSREQMQTSQEELKSANEELQSTNEELQSTNEELTTSKEELQSLNEELQTVNAELMSKVADLSRANNDMKNLLNSTDIATVFLDSALNVRRFTTQATKIIQLIPGDVGRPFTDIASSLVYGRMADDAREVLRTLVFSEKVVGSSDGRLFRIRIMPYRTVDDMIDGVVITFTDVTAIGPEKRP